jgi:hypothetical protein
MIVFDNKIEHVETPTTKAYYDQVSHLQEQLRNLVQNSDAGTSNLVSPKLLSNQLPADESAIQSLLDVFIPQINEVTMDVSPEVSPSNLLEGISTANEISDLLVKHPIMNQNKDKPTDRAKKTVRVFRKNTEGKHESNDELNLNQPFICGCGEEYNEAKLLWIHIEESHKGNVLKGTRTSQLYLCGCGEAYDGAEPLWTHIQGTHKGKIPEGTPPIRLYICGCGKFKYFLYQNLWTHVKENHTNVPKGTLPKTFLSKRRTEEEGEEQSINSENNLAENLQQSHELQTKLSLNRSNQESVRKSVSTTKNKPMFVEAKGIYEETKIKRQKMSASKSENSTL